MVSMGQEFENGWTVWFWLWIPYCRNDQTVAKVETESELEIS